MSSSRNPIEEALEAAREALLAKRLETLELVEAIKRMADGYLAAVDREIAWGFVDRVGLAVAPEAGPSREEAFRALRHAVDALPEGGLQELGLEEDSAEPAPTTSEAEPEIPSEPTAETTVERGPEPPRDSPAPEAFAAVFEAEAPGASRGRQVPRFLPATAPEVLALQREIEAADLPNVSDRLFLAYAEEFAARARILQERNLPEADVEALNRLIRRLTALAHQFNLPRPVYGLSRRHVGDWEGQLRRARHERDRILTGGSNPDGLTQRLKIPEGIKAKIPEPEAEELEAEELEPRDEPLDLPALREASEDRDVLIVGGAVKAEKLDRIRDRTGIEIRWVGLAKGASSSAVRSLSTKIKNGQVAGLVLLEGLMNHKDYDPLIASARQVGLPVAYGGKAGAASLDRALKDLDEKVGGGGSS